MELNQLKCFEVVAHTENISQAAQELYITQPALSRVIARLEKELGVKLFDRVHGRIVLNSEGKILLDHVSAGLAEIETGVRKISSTTLNQRISIYNLCLMDLSDDVMEKCQADFPELKFEYQQLENYERSEIMRSISAHIFLSPMPKVKGYTFGTSFEEKWCVIFNQSYGLKSSKNDGTISLGEMAREPLVVCGSTYDRAFIMDRVEGTGYFQNVRFASKMAEGLLLINRCKCISVVPYGVFRELRREKRLPIEALMLDKEEFRREIFVGTRTNFPAQETESMVLRRFEERLSEYLAEAQRYLEEYIQEKYGPGRG